MRIDGKPYRTIWLQDGIVTLIDQRRLPHEFVTEAIHTAREMVAAIADMHVRGAPLIGVSGAYGVYLAAVEAAGAAAEPEAIRARFAEEVGRLRAARPTAVNLAWAIDRQLERVAAADSWSSRAEVLKANADRMADEDVACCQAIGRHGLAIIEEIAARKAGQPVNILTHCNAGWLATIDYGTATAPIYLAHAAGIALHIWVDETRPRLQGSRLTAYELAHEGVPHTVIVDNAGGHLMQHGQVDLCLVGTDRTTRTGDVANKVGTYLKALAARHNGVPFYVAAPSASIDWSISDGLAEIPIEERDAEEILVIGGPEVGVAGRTTQVHLAPTGSRAANYAFDVTPAELVTGLITERGVSGADEGSLARLFPELKITAESVSASSSRTPFRA